MMKTSKNVVKGRFGETAAEGFLRGKGYSIIVKNYKKGRGEIDIIAKSPDGYIVFTEVKYRKTHALGRPGLAVTKTKIASLRHCASYYIMENQLDCDMRFDVIEIVGTELLEIEHIENAF